MSLIVLLPVAKSQVPELATFAVEGHLKDGGKQRVPFEPAFPAANRFDYKCYLDNIMKKFDLKVDPQEYAVLSALEEDGEEVSSRSQLLGISVEEGAEKIFSITLSSTHSQNVSKYTLQVLRRLGFSTSLENLGFATGHLKETFHPQSEIDVYHALQDVKEDFAEVQCLKQDGGQEVWCTVQHMETLGDGKPSSAEFTLFPELYSPSLETRHSLETYYSGERARTVNCRVPIDTWREVIIGVNITSADKTRHRHLQLIVRRDGCRDDSFFYAGRCILHCPVFHYEQRFNWRCGACGHNCEFCVHFAKCRRCRLDTALKRYELNGGSCKTIHVHPNKVYFFASCYLGAACAALAGIYLTFALWSATSRSAEKDIEGTEDEQMPLTTRQFPHH